MVNTELIGALRKFKLRRDKGLCPFCKKDMKNAEFKNELSQKEYKISGLCQSCQDTTFREQEND